MAVAGYGVEATVESIWDHAWATARFDLINIAIGTRFNFWINGIAQTDITDTSVKAILAVETNDLFAYWNSLAKVEKEIVEIVIPPEPEVPEEIPKINGKKTCPICGKEFAPQGFNSHLKACLKNAEEMEAGEE